MIVVISLAKISVVTLPFIRRPVMTYLVLIIRVLFFVLVHNSPSVPGSASVLQKVFRGRRLNLKLRSWVAVSLLRPLFILTWVGYCRRLG